VKSLLSKRRITQDADLSRFDMPLLRTDLSVGGSADRIEREAYERGYAAGEKAGFEMGQQKAKVLIDKVEALLKELVTLRETIIRAAEPQCIELAVAMARKILMKELTARPEELVNLSKEALLKLERTGQIVIKINPSLYDLFTKHKPELLSVHPDIVFDVDPSISRFGSVVIGPVEEVVTDLDEQLKNLIKDMRDRHGSN